MWFIKEYVRELIMRHMEDPEERERKWKHHVNGVSRAAESA